MRIQKEKDERKMARMLASNGKIKNEKAHSKKSKLKVSSKEGKSELF